MNKPESFRLLICVAVLSASGCVSEDDEAAMTRIVYPATAEVEHVDRYHGMTVADPYRWLEEDVRESQRVRKWVDAQNEVTFAYLAGIPEREAIEARLTELWDYERFGLPVKEGGRYYYSYNDGLMNQAVIYTQPALDAEAKLLIDPNAWSEDGTVALAGYYPGPDGRYVAYLVQEAGSDWNTARVLDVASGETLGDTLQWL